MFYKIQMILIMKTSISNNRLSLLNYPNLNGGVGRGRISYKYLWDFDKQPKDIICNDLQFAITFL